MFTNTMKCVCLLLLTICCLYMPHEPDPPATSQPKVTMRLVGAWHNSPRGTLKLVLTRSGELKDIDFHNVRGDDLPGILRGGDKTAKQRFVKVSLNNEARTSVEVLGKVLRKLRAAADPQTETEVFVY